MRAKTTVEEERRADPTPQRDHYLDAVAADHAQAMHVGVVDDTDWRTEPLREGRLSIESKERLVAEVWSRVHDAAVHHARKAYRDSVEWRKRVRELEGRVDEARGSAWARGREPLTIGEGLSRGIDHGTLDGRRSDVDSQRHR